MEFFCWNIICFGQNKPIKVQFFGRFSALMKFHPIPPAIFETAKSRFIQILHHCSVSWKITPLYFCSSNLVHIPWTAHHNKNFQIFEWKLTKFLMSYLKPQVRFSLNFASFFSVMKELLCTFLAKTLHDLDKRDPSKCNILDFRLHRIPPILYFDRLLLLKV